MVAVDTGLHERDRPVVNVAIDEFDLLAALRPDEIVRDGLIVLQEVILDHVTFVAKTKNEILVAEVGVVLHQVPEDRPRARSAPWASGRHRRSL